MRKKGLKENEIVRHAGVLGLSALVSMNPYGIEKWTPDVLTILARHVSDPSPIKDTVKFLFSEFWRTHQDTWPLLKEKFTEDQLSVISSVSHTSYFA